MSLRIAGGAARGRPLQVPPAGTRPTSERARAGLFNRLDTLLELDGAVVLDLFAGSGAVGIEAVSRGARTAVLVDGDRRAAEVIRANARAAGAVVAVHAATVATFLAAGAAPPAPFDVVFADPPYSLPDAAVDALLAALMQPGWLSGGAVVVVERANRSGEPAWPAEMEVLGPKRYGEAMLWYGRRP